MVKLKYFFDFRSDDWPWQGPWFYDSGVQPATAIIYYICRHQ